MVAVQGKGDAMRKQHALLAVLFVALLVAMTSCSGDDDGGGTTADGNSVGTAINVVEKDFAIAPSPTSASTGSVTFSVTNEGPSTHEFVVFETDLAPEDLPLADDGTVDEEGEGLTSVDEIEDIAAGDTPTLAVELDPGSYVLICNVPGHYAAGMHAAFTVS
jgi:uncharacterized cupredoxin-like copper-binding protein